MLASEKAGGGERREGLELRSGSLEGHLRPSWNFCQVTSLRSQGKEGWISDIHHRQG